MLHALKRRRGCILGLLLFGSYIVYGATGSELDGTFVDRSPALEIGHYRVTNYITSKYYCRYIDGIEQSYHRSATVAEQHDWFKAFIARNVVIAYAQSLGYHKRGEVLKCVNQMERHMLTQSQGPYYIYMYGQQAAASKALTQLYHDNRSTEVDCLVAQFKDDAQSIDSLGSDFLALSESEKELRVKACAASDDVEVLDTNLSWPFKPIGELASLLLTVPVGIWLKEKVPSFGTYLILIRSRHAKPPTGIGESDAQFLSTLKQSTDELFFQRHHNNLIINSSFTFFPETANRVVDVCANLNGNAYIIPEDSMNSFINLPLFRFMVGSELKIVTTHEYAAYFNDQFLRSIPRDLPALRKSAEDMAVAELDIRAARKMGIDQTEQFQEDREGYSALVALDLFEKDILLAQLEETGPDVLKYYIDHKLDFEQVSRIGARLVYFAKLDDALTWNQQRLNLYSVKAKDDVGVGIPVSDSIIEISRSKAITGLEWLQNAFFGASPGTTIGPIKSGKLILLFIRRENLATGMIPFDQAAPHIRPIIERRLLDAREVGFSEELRTRFKVIDKIDYTRYALLAQGRLQENLSR
jgi:hypothetical protein